MMMGILASSATAIALGSLPKPVLVPLAILAGAAGGAAWGGLAGLLKARLEVNEILSTVMLNYIAAQFYTFLLRGPMMDPEELVMGSGTPQTLRMPRSAWLDRLIPGTRLHVITSYSIHYTKLYECIHGTLYQLNDQGIAMPSTNTFSLEIFERIVSLVHEATGHGVNIMGEGGRILASSDPARVGTVHDGGRRVMSGEVEEVAIDAETAATLQNVKAGYMGAVRMEGKLIACISYNFV